jgi:hypothetical protein
MGQRKYDKYEKMAVDFIGVDPGIESSVLAKRLAEISGLPVSTISGVLSDMAGRHQFVRVRATSPDGHFTYKCYMTVPPNVDPKLFLPRGDKQQKSKHTVKTAHPTLKPGTFTVNLELPNGKMEPFTLDEMMRMYSQIGRIVEAFRTAGL